MTFTGGSRAGGGFVFVNLKPKPGRKESSEQVIGRLRPRLMAISGADAADLPAGDVLGRPAWRKPDPERHCSCKCATYTVPN